MNRKRLTLIVVLLLIISTGIILYTFFGPSDPAIQEGRSLQDQQIEHYIQQNDNKPVIQTDEDLLNEMRNN